MVEIDEADEYFELSARFRALVQEAGGSSTGALMRYPGDGNRQERRAARSEALRARRKAARGAKGHG